MVSDKHNQIYTELFNYMKSIYPALHGGTNYRDGESKLPYLYFFQLDAPTRLTTLSNTEDGISLGFQIEIYSDKENTSRIMSNSVREYMIEQGFRCRGFRPIQSASNVSRFVGRYERLDV